MQRVISLAVVLSMVVFAWSHAEAEVKNETKSAIKVKRVKMVVVKPMLVTYSPFHLTKLLLKIAVNPRTKMLSAALEGMTVPLTDGSDQRAARPQAPRVVAVAPVAPLRAPLPTTFQAP